jgi:hypothetical protein
MNNSEIMKLDEYKQYIDRIKEEMRDTVSQTYDEINN